MECVSVKGADDQYSIVEEHQVVVLVIRHGRRRKTHWRRRGAIFWSAAAAFDRRGKFLPEPMLNFVCENFKLRP